MNRTFKFYSEISELVFWKRNKGRNNCTFSARDYEVAPLNTGGTKMRFAGRDLSNKLWNLVGFKLFMTWKISWSSSLLLNIMRARWCRKMRLWGVLKPYRQDILSVQRADLKSLQPVPLNNISNSYKNSCSKNWSCCLDWSQQTGLWRWLALLQTCAHPPSKMCHYKNNFLCIAIQ